MRATRWMVAADTWIYVNRTATFLYRVILLPRDRWWGWRVKKIQPRKTTEEKSFAPNTARPQARESWHVIERARRQSLQNSRLITMTSCNSPSRIQAAAIRVRVKTNNYINECTRRKKTMRTKHLRRCSVVLVVCLPMIYTTYNANDRKCLTTIVYILY